MGAGHERHRDSRGEVAAAANAVVVLDRVTGAVRWQRPAYVGLPTDVERITVTDDAVVVLNGNLAEAEVTVYDLATGQPRFTVRHEEKVRADAAAATRRHLYVSMCPPLIVDPDKDLPKPTDRLCELRSFDLKTGRLVWRKGFRGAWPKEFNALDFVFTAFADRTFGQWRAEDHVEPMRAGEAGPIVTKGYVVGPDPKTDSERPIHPAWVVDPRTGAAAAPWRSKALRETYRVADVVVDVPEGFDEKSNCTGETRAYDIRTGQVRWQLPVSGKRYRHGDARCDSFRPAVVGAAMLAVSADERPILVDVPTGKVRWRGAEGGYPLGLEGDVVVVRVDGTGDVAGVDIATGATKWTVRLPVDRQPGAEPFLLDEVAVVGGKLSYSGLQRFSDGSAGTLHVVDLDTGKELWAARRDNALLGAGNGWLVSASASAPGEAARIELFDL